MLFCYWGNVSLGGSPRLRCPAFIREMGPSTANHIVFSLKFNQPNCLWTFSTPELFCPPEESHSHSYWVINPRRGQVLKPKINPIYLGNTRSHYPRKILDALRHGLYAEEDLIRVAPSSLPIADFLPRSLVYNPKSALSGEVSPSLWLCGES